MIFLNFLMLILFMIGVFLLGLEIIKIPSLQTSLSIITFHNKGKKINKIDAFLNNLAIKIGGYIRLNSYKREKLSLKLKTLNINKTPEKHYAELLIKTLIPIIIAIPITLVFPVTFFLSLVISIRTYLKEKNSLDIKIKEKREKIELEIPRFTRNISENLKSSRNILDILDRYKETAGETFKEELEITLMDMRTGNYETALKRLENRIQSLMLSDVVRGLISVIRGDDSIFFFQLLAHDFKAIEFQKLKKEASQRPSKIKKYSLFLLICIFLMYGIIIVIAIAKGAGGLL